MNRTIIYISPGPVYRPRLESYQDQYRILSGNFSGYILTTSPVSEAIDIYNFKYISMASKYNIVSSFKFAFFCIKQALRLKRNGIKVDLVDSYDPIKSGLIALVVARILGSKFAVQVNGVYTSPAEWVDEANTFTTKAKKKVYPYIMRFVLSHADGIKLLFKNQIAPFAKYVSNKVIRSYPCYVDIDAFSLKRGTGNQNQNNRHEVLFVGFPFKRKGVDVLISAFKSLAGKYPDWNLKILGWFPDTTELNAAIDAHPQINHVKPVNYGEMPGQIECCSIVVLPSRSEAMGRVLVEAMAAGKPRIGSDIDGIPTVINDMDDGLLVVPDSVDDLTSKLDLLMGDDGLRIRLGENGAKRAEKEFSKKVYSDNVTEFYTSIINS